MQQDFGLHVSFADFFVLRLFTRKNLINDSFIIKYNHHVKNKKTVLLLIIFFSVSLCSRAQADVNAKKTVVGKIYFSNQLFGESNAGAKTSFSSSDFIYGRLETNGKKFNEFLQVTPPEKDMAF